MLVLAEAKVVLVGKKNGKLCWHVARQALPHFAYNTFSSFNTHVDPVLRMCASKYAACFSWHNTLFAKGHANTATSDLWHKSCTYPDGYDTSKS